MTRLARCAVLATLLLSACADDSSDAIILHAEVPLSDEPNLNLYVSNQSFELPTLDISIYIDDVLSIDGEYRVEGQHSWFLFPLALTTGQHQLRAVSERGDADLTVDFDVTAEHWAVVNYWFDRESQPKEFSFHVQNEPVTFE